MLLTGSQVYHNAMMIMMSGTAKPHANIKLALLCIFGDYLTIEKKKITFLGDGPSLKFAKNFHLLWVREISRSPQTREEIKNELWFTSM